MKRDDLKIIKNSFVQLADEKTFMKEASFALQAINANPQLKECNHESIQQAVLNVAQTGLTLNPINPLAYLIPRYQKNKGKVCVLNPSYQGLVKLITDTKSVKNVYAYCVYEGDDFKVTLGTSIGVEHEPKFESKKITKVYAVAKLPDGTDQIEVMTIEECHKIRGMSEGFKAYERLKKQNKTIPCVWINHEPEMCRKTVIKRLCKYLPKTEQWDKLNEVIELDNQDYTLDIDSKTVEYISTLANQAKLDDREMDGLNQEIFSGELTSTRANELIMKLKDMMPEPIDSGNNADMGDVHKKLTEQGL